MEIKCVAVDWLQLAQNWSCGEHTLKNVPSDLNTKNFFTHCTTVSFAKEKLSCS